MADEYDNFYKTHMATHCLAHLVHIFVMERLDRFVAVVNEDQRVTLEEWNRKLQSQAKNPKLLKPTVKKNEDAKKVQVQIGCETYQNYTADLGLMAHQTFPLESVDQLKIGNIPSCGKDIAGRFAGKDGVKMLDVQRVLKILKNCKLFPNNDNNSIDKILEIRNEFSHTSTKYRLPKLPGQLMTEHFNSMIELLTYLKVIGMESGEELMGMFREIEHCSTQETLAKIADPGLFKAEDYTDMPMQHRTRFDAILEEFLKSRRMGNSETEDNCESQASFQEDLSQVKEDVEELKKGMSTLNKEMNLLSRKSGTFGTLELLREIESQANLKSEGQDNKLIYIAPNASMYYYGSGASTTNKDANGVQKNGLKTGPSGDNRKRKAPAATEELIKLADINRRSKKGKLFHAEVRDLKPPKLNERSREKSWSFYLLLGDKHITIDCRYFGSEQQCTKVYDYIHQHEQELFSITNYSALKKYNQKNRKDFVKGNHKLCRLEFGPQTYIDVVDK